MKKLTELHKFIILTLFFTVVIFCINILFLKLNENKSYIEINYIEKQIKNNQDLNKEVNNKNQKVNNSQITFENKNNIYQNNQENAEKTKIFNSANRLNTFFNPENYGAIINKDYFYLLQDTLDSAFFDNIFSDEISGVNTHLYQEKSDVRGKMKNRAIFIFGPEYLSKGEFLSVYIHELGHYLDLYLFKKELVGDISDEFYGISWESVKTIKSGAKKEDFVSGYAMTNKYEDFAESFTYYVLHNKSFLKKATKSEIMGKKYRFFSKYVFDDGQFKNTIFAYDEKIKDYYWDITKIKLNYNIFLQYIKK